MEMHHTYEKVNEEYAEQVSDGSLDPRQPRHRVALNVIRMRREFAEFMLNFTDDFDIDHRAYDEFGSYYRPPITVWQYFELWITSKYPRLENKEDPFPYGKQAYEDFFQLLPLVFITIVDSLQHDPTFLDLAPLSLNGEQRIKRHREFSGTMYPPPGNLDEYDFVLLNTQMYPFPAIFFSLPPAQEP